MIKVDLITGFLGSGKTTFLKKYASHLMESGQKIGILENDYGAVNVDMMLLKELRSENCELEMVAGGCDADCHKRRFKTKLISMGMYGYDRVLIEPSGIFDVDEFFDSLYEEPLCNWYEIGNVIAVVDAALEDNLSEQSDFLLASQIANAGKIVLSKVQDASKSDIDVTTNHLHRVMDQFQCKRNFEDALLIKDWNDLTDTDYANLLACGYVQESYKKIAFSQENAYDSLYYMNVRLTEDELKKQVTDLFQDSLCGNVFRVKGFLQMGNDRWLELNATRSTFSLKPIAEGQEIIIIIGENLNQAKIDSVWK